MELPQVLPGIFPRDPHGVPDGPEYLPILRAGVDNTRGTASSDIAGPKGACPECLSVTERNLLFELHLVPSVLSIRTQYPACDWDVIRQYFEAGKPIPAFDVPTLDIVATLWRPDAKGALGYHGFSVKPASDLTKANTVRQLLRDRAFCQKLGWGWSLYTNRDVRPHSASAGKKMLYWSRDLQVTRGEAEKFAKLLKRQTKDHNLGVRLANCANRLDLEPQYCQAYFAHCILFGHLVLDPRYPLGLKSPLRMKTAQHG